MPKTNVNASLPEILSFQLFHSIQFLLRVFMAGISNRRGGDRKGALRKVKSIRTLVFVQFTFKIQPAFIRNALFFAFVSSIPSHDGFAGLPEPSFDQIKSSLTLFYHGGFTL